MALKLTLDDDDDDKCPQLLAGGARCASRSSLQGHRHGCCIEATAVLPYTHCLSVPPHGTCAIPYLRTSSPCTNAGTAAVKLTMCCCPMFDQQQSAPCRTSTQSFQPLSCPSISCLRCASFTADAHTDLDSSNSQQDASARLRWQWTAGMTGELTGRLCSTTESWIGWLSTIQALQNCKNV